jgi:hypothetical protein
MGSFFSEPNKEEPKQEEKQDMQNIILPEPIIETSITPSGTITTIDPIEIKILNELKLKRYRRLTLKDLDL